MNIRPAFTLLLASTLISPALFAADAPAAAAPAAAPSVAPAAPNAAPSAAPDDEKKTDLEARMDRVSKAFRKLRKQVADPARNASSLELLSTMDAALKEAVEFTPAKAADLPEDQRPKFMEDFKAGIKGMQDELAKLRGALTAGKNEDAVKIVAEISALEKKDHKQFKKPKPD